MVVMALTMASRSLAADPTGAITLRAHPEAPLDYAWVLICAFLVFFMQAGFAMVEAGFCRSKNAVNLMRKNLMDFVMDSLVFFATGYAIMMGKDWDGTPAYPEFTL